ncbi:TNF receptor-associated factor family protein DDB_G0277243-like [Actinia tenebrosa]|uniref:TNF receptor-associated factor family protein DDB_G0277243-like n=1 Tax=Actinia tenebrosa TaxID=6105 RepID=A0A6P8IJ64_ACTTE|nr:TNF receptor-associated factor family protein DDB_G0277243-like [Actinia tenebrosa]XP_031566529.1 TNF receptor-associated factor family protein DDB_G0277243-like [Actinia tenebrosa]
MGFKAELFLKSIDENLFCSICHEVFEDPVSCKDGHTFCKDCITTWLKTNKKCPLDNGSLEEKQLVRLLTVRGIIDNLDVYCHPQSFQNELPTSEIKAGDSKVGCEWIGKLQNLLQHRKTCPFLEMQCPHGCNEKIQRRKMEDHDEICEQKLIDCSECGLNLPRKDLEKHKANKCLQALVSCPNECRNNEEEIIKKIKRIDLADHLSNVCPKGLVDCAYKEQGCEVKVERQDVEKHVQENMSGHMMLLAKECSFLRKQNTSLTDQCSSLVHKNEKLNKELSQVKNNLERIKDEIPNTYTWKIQNFRSQARKRNVHFFRSPTFWLCGYCWYLKIYPNGERDNKGYLTLYLHACCNDSTHGTSMVVVPNGQISVFFRLKVLSQNPFKDISFEKNDVFSYEELEGSGWDVMKTGVALSPVYCTNGSLTIQCTIQLDKPQ